MTAPRLPNVLTIAGSDSGGGAGVQADLKAFSALGAYGASVLCALTAQNTRAVTAIHDVPPEFVTAQIDAVFDDLRIDAVKIGMLSRPEVIAAVAEGLRRHDAGPVVVDPVMVAKSGDRLLAADATRALVQDLLPLAAVLTPNLPEAGVLLDRPAPTTRDEMAAAARDLLAMGPEWVLLKGGHLDGDTSPDHLAARSGETLWLESARIPTANTHGTGCTLSSAIAARLGHGREVPDAVRDAKDYLRGAIAAADQLDVGHGHGPVHHFHALWRT